jgi:acetolactate synthase-1/2/3 large subunit
VWVVWNNFAWAAIRDLQYAYFEGREYGTAFYQGANRRAYNPDVAAWAKAAGVAGHTVTRSQDFAGVLAEAVAAGKPALIDVHVDADIRPPGTGAWALPPIPPKQPVFGKPWTPDAA